MEALIPVPLFATATDGTRTEGRDKSLLNDTVAAAAAADAFSSAATRSLLCVRGLDTACPSVHLGASLRAVPAHHGHIYIYISVAAAKDAARGAHSNSHSSILVRAHYLNRILLRRRSRRTFPDCNDIRPASRCDSVVINLGAGRRRPRRPRRLWSCCPRSRSGVPPITVDDHAVIVSPESFHFDSAARS